MKGIVLVLALAVQADAFGRSWSYEDYPLCENPSDFQPDAVTDWTCVIVWEERNFDEASCPTDEGWFYHFDTDRNTHYCVTAPRLGGTNSVFRGVDDVQGACEAMGYEFYPSTCAKPADITINDEEITWHYGAFHGQYDTHQEMCFSASQDLDDSDVIRKIVMANLRDTCCGGNPTVCDEVIADDVPQICQSDDLFMENGIGSWFCYAFEASTHDATRTCPLIQYPGDDASEYTCGLHSSHAGDLDMTDELCIEMGGTSLHRDYCASTVREEWSEVENPDDPWYVCVHHTSLAAAGEVCCEGGASICSELGENADLCADPSMYNEEDAPGGYTCHYWSDENGHTDNRRSFAEMTGLSCPWPFDLRGEYDADRMEFVYFCDIRSFSGIASAPDTMTEEECTALGGVELNEYEARCTQYMSLAAAPFTRESCRTEHHVAGESFYPVHDLNHFGKTCCGESTDVCSSVLFDSGSVCEAGSDFLPDTVVQFGCRFWDTIPEEALNWYWALKAYDQDIMDCLESKGYSPSTWFEADESLGDTSTCWLWQHNWQHNEDIPEGEDEAKEWCEAKGGQFRTVDCEESMRNIFKNTDPSDMWYNGINEESCTQSNMQPGNYFDYLTSQCCSTGVSACAQYSAA